MNILKADPKQQIVYGWAGQYLDATGAPLEDLQGDIVSPEEIEKASYDYVLNKRESGVMHEGKTVGHIVASFVTTPDVVKAFFGEDVHVPVGWIIGVKYPDKDVFKKVVDGEYAMFSIQGNADRVEVDDDDVDEATMKRFVKALRKWVDASGVDSHGRAESASTKARGATKLATLHGTRAAHLAARDAHKEAARAHESNGSSDKAAEHERQAAFHNEKGQSRRT